MAIRLGQREQKVLGNKELKRTGRVAQAVVHLPSKHDNLSSNPSITKKKKKKVKEPRGKGWDRPSNGY
jgi:hypothetical protein